MASPPPTSQALAALAKDAGFDFDPQRLHAVADTLAFIRAAIGKLEELDLDDRDLSQPFNVEWR